MPRHVVVCGAGSAGCTLAARLTEDPEISVTLLEAGPDFETPESLPEAISSAWQMGGPPYDWGFSSGGAPMPRGRLVGGSSAVNGTNAVRAFASDFDRWAPLGADEWSWDAVLPYFRKLEDDAAPGDWHGSGGPVKVRRFDDERTPLTNAFVETCIEAGHPYVEDVNGPNPVGVGLLAMNQLDGKRLSIAISYLTAEVRARPNLTIRPDSLIDRVEVEDGRARAVVLASGERIDGDTVIVSAGSYCSPAILMRSGVGAPEALGALGIPVVHANEAVGATLRDHPFVLMAFMTTNAFQHANPPLQTGVHLSTLGNATETDVDLTFYPFSHPKLGGALRHLLPTDVDAPTIFIGVCLTRPYSVGRLELESRDPAAAPRIVNNLYSHPEDVGRIVEGIKRVRSLVQVGPLAEYVDQELFPGPGVSDDAAIADAVRAVPTSQNHPIATCSIGPAGSAWGVVDQRGAVHGVDDLYVIDASIMPVLPSVPLNMTTVMIAERCADLLRASFDSSAATAGAATA